jgi:hypothetical protein
VTAPPWLAGTFAAIMILTAAYSASRLAFSRLRGRATELDADALHAVMGVAMAGMLLPWLHLAPNGLWVAVFGIGAVWFGWHALPARGAIAPRLSQCRYPVPHLVECAAMVYMLLPGHRPPGGSAMAMPGMGAAPGSQQGFPVLAVILALFMLGYIVWTTDRLTSRTAQPTTVTAVRSSSGEHRSPLAAVGTRVTGATSPVGLNDQAGAPALAPRLAACTKIAMGLTMGYMLILML